jgi:hypothetical protein
MLNPAAAQQIKIFLICGLGLLLAIFLGTQIGGEHYGELALWAVVAGMAALVLFSGRFYWILAIASSFLAGTFPILGGQFTPFQILMAIGVAKFFVGDVVLRRTKLKVGPRFNAFLIMCFMAVLIWHGVHDRFGMKFLGSSIWGGRYYVSVFVGLAAFAVIQSVPVPSKLWAKLPYMILAVTTFDLLIGIITTIYPSAIFKIYPFYSAVSVAGVEEITSGESLTGRVVTFGSFGFIVITIVLSTASMSQVLSLSNLRRGASLIIGLAAVLYSGFRTSVFNTLIVSLIAGIRDLKFKVLLLLPLIGILFFALSVLNSEFVRLPRQVQRSLAFLPGNWDSEMRRDVEGSNDFRRQVWTTFTREFFPAHPWIGRGFGFKSEWGRIRTNRSEVEANRQNVETGNVHNGFLSCLDAFGIIGTIFFVLWNLSLLRRSLGVPFRKSDPEGVALRFVALYLATSIIGFWMGAPSVGTFLPTEFALAGVLLRLQREEQAEAKEPMRSLRTQEESAAERLVARR